ncbi:MAG: universal stress protein [Lysobacteraceae bacterium]
MPLLFRKMLVATDFSERAGLATRRAAQLSAAHGASLELFAAPPLPLPPMIWGDMAGLPLPDAADLLDAAQSRLTAQAETLRQQFDVEISVHVRAGLAGRLVTARAEEIGADLLVIGATGEGALAGRLLGSTAQDIVRGSRTPVLVVRTPAAQAYGRVLAAVDFTQDAARAVRIARALVPSAALSVFTALELPRLPWTLFDGLDEEARKLRIASAHSGTVQRLQRLVADLGVADAGIVVREGRASHELVAAVEEGRADLLCLGAHGKGRFEAGLLGSVSLHAIAEAPCDVLVAPVKG